MRNHPVSCWDNNQLICTQPEALSQLLCCSAQGRFCYCLQTLLCAFSTRHNQLVSTRVLSTRQYITLQLVRKKLILSDRLCYVRGDTQRWPKVELYIQNSLRLFQFNSVHPLWVLIQSLIVCRIKSTTKAVYTQS